MTGMSLHQDWPLTCVPPGLSRSQRWMEKHIQNLIQLFRVVSNAWRACQCTHSLSMIYDRCHSIIYLDNILIYSENMTKHKAHVQEVLWRLQANGLLPKPISVSFMSPPVNTSDICCHLKVLPWLCTKSRLFRIGQSPKRHSILAQLCQLLLMFYLWILVMSECTALLGWISGYRGVFGQWLQLMYCANLLASGSKYFYNQCPQVPNFIGTERSLNRSEHRVQNEASLRVIWIDGIQNTEVFPIGLEFGIWKPDISNIWK